MLLLMLFVIQPQEGRNHMWKLLRYRQVVQKILDIHEWQLSMCWGMSPKRLNRGMAWLLLQFKDSLRVEDSLEARRPGGSLSLSSR